MIYRTICRILALFAVVGFLAACETAPKDRSGASAQSEQDKKQEQLVNIGNVVYFDYDSSVLSTEARSTLNAQAAFLRSNPSVRVIIQGHCDERGTREYNLALGERRASAARDYLVAQGIDGARLRTISFGKERPEAVGSTEAAWAKNRRSVSVIR